MALSTYIEALKSGEDFMLRRLYAYASEAEYTKYTSTKEDDWRMTLREPARMLIEYLQHHDEPDSIHVDEKSTQNQATAFGMLEAKRHRDRGVRFDMFLGLTKLVRQAFVDLTYETAMTDEERKKALAITQRFFDKFELGFCAEWVRHQESDLVVELQDTNRRMTNEKNRYLTIFQSIADPVFVVDSEMRLVEVNAVFETFFGMSRQQATKKKCQDVIACGICAACPIKEAVNTRSPVAGVETVIHQMGEERRVLISGAHLDDISDKYQGGVGIIQDITGRKRAEAFREKLLHDVGERVKELNCLYRVSEIGAEPGRSLDEVLRETVELIPPAWQYPEITCGRVILDGCEFTTANFSETEWKQSADIIVSGKRAGAVEVYYLEEKPEIDEGPFLKEERNLIDALGRLIGSTTERKRADEELQKAYEQEKALRRELEVEAKRRTEFLRALVHELKTPVTAVMASGEMLSLELPEGPLLSLAKNLYRSADNLKKRVDELLDLARGEMGMLQLKLKPLEPLQLIDKVFNDMSLMVSGRGQSLSLNLPSSLPAVWADEERLYQVLLNLLGNASKYMTEGGKIAIEARGQDSHVIVEVHDTGPGIDEEDQERLFDAYYRVADDRQRLSGLGLGLPLCKTLVELHGGQIWVKSKKGEGSIFGFSVPLAAAIQVQQAPEAAEAR